MRSFLEDILNGNVTGSVSGTVKTDLQDSKPRQMLNKLDVNLGNADLGGIVQGVLNVISLADKAVDKVSDQEDIEE